MHPLLTSADPRQRAWLVPDGGDPLHPDAAWVRRFLAQGTWDRSALADALGWDVDTAWRGGGAVVVAGQQPAFGGGPVYTLVKTAQAIALARSLSTSAHPVRPVFWCASDDHDLGEADHVDLIARDGRIHRQRIDLGGQRALHRISAAGGWTDLLAACRAILGPGLGEDFLRQSGPRADETFGVWHCRLLEALFPGCGLLTLEPRHLRGIWADAIAACVAGWPTQALQRRRDDLIAAGLADAFGDLPAPPLFLDEAQTRRSLTPTEARALAGARPADLSPGAAIRPVVQQAALPAAVVILGPGEQAYHAVLEPLYARLALPRPLPVPRSTVTIEPAWYRRGREAWQTAAEGPVDLGAIDRAIDAVDALALPPAMAAARAAGLHRLRRERHRLQCSLDRIQRNLAGRPPRGGLDAWERPRGAGQDRTLSLVQAVWEWGPGLADDLVRAIAAHPPGSAISVPV